MNKATAIEAVEAIQAALDAWNAAKRDGIKVTDASLAAWVALQQACTPDNIRTVLASLAARQLEVVVLRSLLTRYRNETPLGYQPHMIAQEVDVALTQGAQS